MKRYIKTFVKISYVALLHVLAVSADATFKEWRFASELRFLPRSQEEFDRTLAPMVFDGFDRMSSIEKRQLQQSAQEIMKGKVIAGESIITSDGEVFLSESFQLGGKGLIPVVCYSDSKNFIRFSGGYGAVSSEDVISTELNDEYKIVLFGVANFLRKRPVWSSKSALNSNTLTREIHGVNARRMQVVFDNKHRDRIVRIATFIGEPGRIDNKISESRVSYLADGKIASIESTAYSNGVSRSVRKHRLKSLNRANQVSIANALRTGSTVTDYRLTDGAPMIKANIARKVNYVWNGSLPAKADLRRLELGSAIGLKSKVFLAPGIIGLCVLTGYLIRLRLSKRNSRDSAVIFSDNR